MSAVSGQREKVTHGNRSGFEYSQKSSEGIIRLQAGACDSAGAWIQKVPEQKHQGHTRGGAADSVPTVGTVRQGFQG